MTTHGLTNHKNKVLQPGKQRSISWLLANLDSYVRLNYRVLRQGIPLKELLILKYPFIFGDSALPPLLSVDFTDCCNLNCIYCNHPWLPEQRSFMSDEVFTSLINRISRHQVNRIRVSGGEPTLHPKLGDFLSELSSRCKFLSLITNGQWQDDTITKTIMQSGVSLIEMSLDAGGREMYEQSRKGASYQRFFSNLKDMSRLKKQAKSRCIIKVRLMLRPSTLDHAARESAYLTQFCDCVIPQFILQHPDTPPQDDVFIQASRIENAQPVCSVPFRDLQIRPDGRVPLCPAKGTCTNLSKRVFIGDIRINDINDLWNHPKLFQLRLAHRLRRGKILELCRACHYG